MYLYSKIVGKNNKFNSINAATSISHHIPKQRSKTLSELRDDCNTLLKTNVNLVEYVDAIKDKAEAENNMIYGYSGFTKIVTQIPRKDGLEIDAFFKDVSIKNGNRTSINQRRPHTAKKSDSLESSFKSQSCQNSFDEISLHYKTSQDTDLTQVSKCSKTKKHVLVENISNKPFKKFFTDAVTKHKNLQTIERKPVVFDNNKILKCNFDVQTKVKDLDKKPQKYKRRSVGMTVMLGTKDRIIKDKETLEVEDKSTQMYDYLDGADLYTVEWINKNLFKVSMNPELMIVEDRIKSASKMCRL